MNGRIHSLETFGTVDGPGIRFVVFVQGCPMRCLYCHNPDTWATTGGTEISVDEILQKYEDNKSFYKNGGLTVTGGEPLLQIDFLTELFMKAKAQGIHTCIDTSGIVFKPDNKVIVDKMDVLMQYTDLVMLDIKHIDPEEHMKLCSQPNDGILAFAEYLSDKGIPTWIRHVVVPALPPPRLPHPMYLKPHASPALCTVLMTLCACFRALSDRHSCIYLHPNTTCCSATGAQP